MKKKLKAAIAGLGLLSLIGCTDVPENNVAVRKTVGGDVHFYDGPKWDFLGLGTITIEWDGRRIIDLPVSRGSEQSQHYATKDGYLMIDLNVNYKLSKEAADREKWFLKISNAEEQFPQAVEGVVRSTVKGYTNNEILNEELAKKHGKLPIYLQIAADLSKAPINEQYGVDIKEYAVWPGNLSPLEKSVQADLSRQRQIILRRARADAQKFKEKASSVKADVDGEYSRFIKNLQPAQQKYLKTLDMVNAIKQVGKDKEQNIDIQLFVE